VLPDFLFRTAFCMGVNGHIFRICSDPVRLFDRPGSRSLFWIDHRNRLHFKFPNKTYLFFSTPVHPHQLSNDLDLACGARNAWTKVSGFTIVNGFTFQWKPLHYTPLLRASDGVPSLKFSFSNGFRRGGALREERAALRIQSRQRRRLGGVSGGHGR